MLVRYGTTQKGYGIYDLVNTYFFISKYFMFMENIFPFKESIADQQRHT